jgi:hypothetical protein
VARGYRNNPSLTAERFVTGAGSGERHYRTGDLARWSGSVLHFLGRIDRQLKVGGYRVEPGEVEKALVARAGVAHAAVTVQTDADGTALLVAHVVPVAGADVAEQDLRQHCATLLPAYLRPSLYRLTDTLPLTVSGKIDFAALPSVEPTPDRGPGDAEQTVAIVWRDLLGRPVGPDDNFFALGGHSLLAIRAVSRVREQLGVVLSINDIYEHPSLADFTAVAVRAGEGRR